MKFARALKRKFGIAAPRMAVRTHIAWYWRGLVLGVFVAVGVICAWWIYDTGSRLAGFERGEAKQELHQLAERAARLEAENRELHVTSLKARQQLEIEQATQSDLAKSVKTLQDENAGLKEDVAFFRSLMSSDRGDGALGIYHFKVERGALPGEYRYRLLLLQSGQQREQEFRGSVQFVVNAVQGARKIVLAIPDAKEPRREGLNVSFKYYQRLEGSFQVASPAIVKTVQVRVFENSAAQPKLMRVVNVS